MQNPHAIIGIITILLVFVQPFTSTYFRPDLIPVYFRPIPEADKLAWQRKILQRAHYGQMGFLFISLAVNRIESIDLFNKYQNMLLIIYSCLHLLGRHVLAKAALPDWVTGFSSPTQVFTFILTTCYR